MPVQLIIKSAAQSVEDFKLDCEMSWTIAHVKDQLSELYPTEPAREHQKLIYGGKLLPDHLPLKSILNPSQDIHILHLVCPFPLKSETNKSDSNQKERSEPSDCTAPPLNPPSIYPPVNQQLPTPPVLSATPGVAGAFPFNTPGDAIHQYLAMQQMYTQFMTQYLSQYNGVSPYGQANISAAPVQTPPHSPALERNVNQNNEPRPAVERWDAIDILYIFSRATMLFAILIYYSSPHRVLAVLALVIFLSLFAKVNRERQHLEMLRANERQTTENTTAEEADVDTESVGNPDSTENTSTESQPGPTASQSHIQTVLSVPYTILTVVTSFFTSLIPTDPMPVNVN